MRMAQYMVVQPYGREPGEGTAISEHATPEAAFAEIDRIAAEMVRTGHRVTQFN